MSTTTRKRRRTSAPVFQAQKKRPIDKNLICINKAWSAASTQMETTLITATFPATITGVRWSLNVWTADSSSTGILTWAIIRVKDGLSASTLSFSDGGTVFEPEQEVLAFGSSVLQQNDLNAGPLTQHFEGDTKTMRKLMGGDKIMFIAKPEAVWTGGIDGVIQFFAKS